MKIVMMPDTVSLYGVRHDDGRYGVMMVRRYGERFTDVYRPRYAVDANVERTSEVEGWTKLAECKDLTDEEAIKMAMSDTEMMD